MKLKIEVPGREAPGYFRRQRVAMEVQKQLGERTPESVDSMVNYLLPFVKEPVDRKVATEALWDASQEQIDEILAAIRGEREENPTEARLGDEPV